MASGTSGAKQLKRPQLKNIDALFGLDGADAEGKLVVQDLDITALEPFENHPFYLYDGERLDDMVESVKANGVLVPILVRKKPNSENLEILAGHNRVNAANIAGLTTIPGINLGEIPQEEALAYVIETNLMQRSFSDMKHSEKAAVLALHHSKMFSQGKRNDIIRQLEKLENKDFSADKPTSSQLAKKFDLEQILLWDCFEIGVAKKVSIAQAADLRELSERGELNKQSMVAVLRGQSASAPPKSPPIRVSNTVYSRYFNKKQSAQEIQTIVEEALELYFSKEGVASG